MLCTDRESCSVSCGECRRVGPRDQKPACLIEVIPTILRRRARFHRQQTGGGGQIRSMLDEWNRSRCSMPGQLLQIVSVLVALQHVTSDAPPWSPTSSAPSKLSATECDLRRARQWTPRAEYRGRGTLSAANALLNRHLTAHEGISLQPCETFDVSTLRELMLHLFSRASPYLSASYSASDGRHARYASVDEMEAE